MTLDLIGLGHPGVVRYHDGHDVAPTLSPRPYLTAAIGGGLALTDVSPADHLHHLGISLALPDVNGTSFWGGRTYRRGDGSILLDNHGTQRVRERELADGHLVEHLDWRTREGALLLVERRTIAVAEREVGWDLVWQSELTPAARDVSFGSPQTNGRDGAFYGGIFWRAPFGGAEVRTADGVGVEIAHGSHSPWLELTAGEVVLVAATSTGMPWFVRAEGYVGFCPAIAVDQRRVLPAGQSLHLDLAVAVRGVRRTGTDAVEGPDIIAERLLSSLRERV